MGSLQNWGLLCSLYTFLSTNVGFITTKAITKAITNTKIPKVSTKTIRTSKARATVTA